MQHGPVASSEAPIAPTARTTVRRKRERGSHDRELIYSILDEGLICDVGFIDAGTVFVQPMAYGRLGADVYLHGAPANRALRRLASGSEACLTVTLVDGLVFSRSAFHHSMNYRSVMLIGRGQEVADSDEKLLAVLAVVDHMAAGRSADARPPSPAELRATSVIRFPIVEASAKVRTGGPVEEPEDLALGVWAGELPLEHRTLPPRPAADLPPGLDVPGYIAGYDDARLLRGTDGVETGTIRGPGLR